MDGYYSKPSTDQSLAPVSRKRKREAQRKKIQSSSTKLSNFSTNNLPDSLLIEILLRLPSAISATRCKSVCKRWLSLVSTKYFVQRFLHHHNDNSSKTWPFTLILNYLGEDPNYNKKFPSTSKELLFNSSRFMLSYLPCFINGGICIIASFNDLLLCCPSKEDHSVYYICNPLTMKWMALPPTPSKYKHDTEIQVGFICDLYAYRNDQEEYRYAVMRIHILNGSVAVEIFSSETQEWREFNVLCPKEVRWTKDDFSGVAYNGMLHWLTVRRSIIAYDPYHIEQCRFVDCPKVPAGFICLRLGVCCGFLRILQLSSTQNQYLTVWDLEDYNTGEWKLIYNVNLDEMISNSSSVWKYIKGKSHKSKKYIAFKDRTVKVVELASHPNNGDIVYLGFCNHIFSCNMQRRELEVVSKIPIESGTFKGNLFPLLLPWWPTPVPRFPHNSSHGKLFK